MFILSIDLLSRVSFCDALLCMSCRSPGVTRGFLSLGFTTCVDGNKGIPVCERQGHSRNRGHGVG